MNRTEEELLHRYLDGAITPEEFESLEGLLRDSAEARATLRSLATIDAKWQQLASDDIAVASSSNEPKDKRTLGERNGSRLPLWLMLTALAASLVIAAFGWFRSPEERTIEVERGIARVIRIEGEGANRAQQKLVDEAELHAGDELAMRQGLIELAFRETGVHVVATAPLKLKLDSDQRLSLYEGQVKLVVPPQGIGFVVDTAQRKFVDLGTSFVVSAGAKGSEVLVLDGQISVDDHDGTEAELMHEGEFARFDRDGKIKKRTATRLSQALPELSLAATHPGNDALQGVILGYENGATISKQILSEDVIVREFLPLIRSGFDDDSNFESLKHGEPLRFRGIAGAFHKFPDKTGLTPYSREGGWMAWYHGQVIPPAAGRYRFWGYADNHMLIAINGKPVYEGSRCDSSFRDLGIKRTDNPALPCLIARAGFAHSEWIELGSEPIRLDLLFGEVGGNITSGLLLVEREGEVYEETFWGQPKWPLFLTEVPIAEEAAEFKRLAEHLERKTMGSFSVSSDAIWQVAD